MRVVIDIEANGLENPTKIWVIVCKDIDTGDLHIFREVTENDDQRESFRKFIEGCDYIIGHNWTGYDAPVIVRLVRPSLSCTVIDTFIVSKLVDYSRPEGHSIEAYGEEFGIAKGIPLEDGTTISSEVFPKDFFSYYSKEMEAYCVRDVEICHRIYNKYLDIINDIHWRDSIIMEQEFQGVVNSLHSNGFAFNSSRANSLLDNIQNDLSKIDQEILEAFPPREVLIREFTPKLTKFGTISKSSVPTALRDQIHLYEAGKTYKQTKMVPFNPSSVKQIITVLNEANWKPVSKTKTHIETERAIQRLRYNGNSTHLDLETLYAKLGQCQIFGWKINEDNLSSLPESAPASARLLAKRILLESRRRTLTEWLSLVQPDGRIHGKFIGIGAWTHRMAHQNPNCANIPTGARLYGDEMRSLWRAPSNRLLVGVDAEGIQLRVFAHYIDDKEFTNALVCGRKEDKSDPHSLNARVLGGICKGRQVAKRFIYALLLGAGIGKLSEILDASRSDTERALARLLERYKGFATLKSTVLPQDGKRGYFIGLDGRKVPIPGESASSKTHLAMSGYLQNGEAIIMKRACLLWHSMLQDEFKIVNFVHDEWQTEVANDVNLAMRVAKIQADSLRIVGEELQLKCPLAGSYWNDDHKDWTIGKNWSVTH